MKNSVQMWVIAGALVAIATVMVGVVMLCGGYYFVVAPLAEEQRREELLRREPWRRYELTNGF